MAIKQDGDSVFVSKILQLLDVYLGEIYEEMC